MVSASGVVVTTATGSPIMDAAPKTSAGSALATTASTFVTEKSSLDQMPCGKEVNKFSGSSLPRDLDAGLFRWPFRSRNQHIAHIGGLGPSRQAKIRQRGDRNLFLFGFPNGLEVWQLRLTGLFGQRHDRRRRSRQGQLLGLGIRHRCHGPVSNLNGIRPYDVWAA